MSFGIRVRDEWGNVILDMGMRSGFIIGAVTLSTNNQSGSLADAGLSQGEPFYFLESSSLGAGPDVTFSGTQMSWQSSDPSNVWGGDIYYGIR